VKDILSLILVVKLIFQRIVIFCIYLLSCAVGRATQVERWNIFARCNCCWKGWLWTSRE